jgi:hypothetical protein
MGFRGRSGFGRGFSGYQPAYPTPVDAGNELDILKMQAESCKNTLDAINRRMAELEKISE